MTPPNQFFKMPRVRYRLFERAIIYCIDALQAGESVQGFPEIDLAKAQQGVSTEFGENSTLRNFML
jgi:hypothetical protein